MRIELLPFVGALSITVEGIVLENSIEGKEIKKNLSIVYNSVTEEEFFKNIVEFLQVSYCNEDEINRTLDKINKIIIKANFL